MILHSKIKKMMQNKEVQNFKQITNITKILNVSSKGIE